eukprot:Lithocolla_globosa_v1_NODE_316_length_4526_cov_4.454403.p3 type:complete len:175 gc:universal NODE_316_length_4526_cov_4.454403:1902-1378(-)
MCHPGVFCSISSSSISSSILAFRFLFLGVSSMGSPKRTKPLSTRDGCFLSSLVFFCFLEPGFATVPKTKAQAKRTNGTIMTSIKHPNWTNNKNSGPIKISERESFLAEVGTFLAEVGRCFPPSSGNWEARCASHLLPGKMTTLFWILCPGIHPRTSNSRAEAAHMDASQSISRR